MWCEQMREAQLRRVTFTRGSEYTKHADEIRHQSETEREREGGKSRDELEMESTALEAYHLEHFCIK